MKPEIDVKSWERGYEDGLRRRPAWSGPFHEYSYSSGYIEGEARRHGLESVKNDFTRQFDAEFPEPTDSRDGRRSGPGPATKPTS